MTVRYQANADLNQAIVTGVLRREPTIDFQTAFAALKRDLESQTKQNDQLREQFTEYVRMEEIKKTVHGASDFIKDLLRPW